ncbi:MAG TPA: hydantoinase/oxoprolinase family protein [Chloroflexota bacterium]|nr:hydantoinase/oxoprolinase family protein [Chloroflexota bacterium]
MFKACIDTGGTFTDCVVRDGEGKMREFKPPSTPPDFSTGVVNSLREAAQGYGLSLEDFLKDTETIVHGTTAATNALVTKNGARTALITTEGFRDIIEMGRSLKIDTHSMYDGYIPPYEPLVPRYLRFTVKEKTKSTGEIIKPVSEDELLEVIEKIKQEKIEALAICFINCYVNPENELKAADFCAKHLPDVFVTASCKILPKMGEYERESTCVISAYLGPVVNRYLSNLDEELKRQGFGGQLLIMQSNTYAQSVRAVTEKPAYLMGSGPAAAPAGAAFLGTYTNEPNLITADVGGTTFDAGQVRTGNVSLVSGQWLGEDRLGLKVVDVTSLGAGGGSIGWIDSLGLLKVGPQSAGADPGPACYGHGNMEPTITDACLLLGYMSDDYFWGGKLPLHKDLAREAMRKVSEPLKLSVEEAAMAMIITCSSNMADGTTEITTRQGYDIRDYSLLAIGGGGGWSGAYVANILGMKRVIVPRFSASFSAWSMFCLDLGRDYLRPYVSMVNFANLDTINRLYGHMINEAKDEFKALHVGPADIIFEKSMDLCYKGQYHDLEVSLGQVDWITQETLDQIDKDFHQKHKELFTFNLPYVPIVMKNLRLIAKVQTQKPSLSKVPAGQAPWNGAAVAQAPIGDPSAALKRERLAYWDGRFMNTPLGF